MNTLENAFHQALAGYNPALANLSQPTVASLLDLLRDDPDLTLDLTHRLTRQDTTDGFLLRFGFVPQVDLETAEACLSTDNFSLIETEDEEWASTAVRERVWLALFYVTNEALALQGGPVRWAVAA